MLISLPCSKHLYVKGVALLTAAQNLLLFLVTNPLTPIQLLEFAKRIKNKKYVCLICRVF